MKKKIRSVDILSVIKYNSGRRDEVLSYSIDERMWNKTEKRYYTSLTVCKHGITYHGVMNPRDKGFKTVNGAKAQLRSLLLKIGRNTSIEKDIAKLPIFEGQIQTTFNF